MPGRRSLCAAAPQRANGWTAGRGGRSTGACGTAPRRSCRPTAATTVPLSPRATCVRRDYRSPSPQDGPSSRPRRPFAARSRPRPLIATADCSLAGQSVTLTCYLSTIVRLALIACGSNVFIHIIDGKCANSHFIKPLLESRFKSRPFGLRVRVFNTPLSNPFYTYRYSLISY